MWFTFLGHLQIAGERKLDLKFVSAGNTEYTSVQLFSEEDGVPPSRIFIAIIVSRSSFYMLFDSAFMHDIFGSVIK